MANWAKIDNTNIVKEIVVFDDGVTPQIVLSEGWQWVNTTDKEGFPSIDGKYEDGVFHIPASQLIGAPDTPAPNDGKNYNWINGAWVEKTPQREVPEKPNDTAKFNFDTWEWETQ
jgi:hypothetical protein